MRVAVHYPDGSVAAFREGRVQDFENVLTGEITPAKQVAERFVEMAKAEHPDCEIVMERLVDNGDDTSRWVKADEVPEGALSPEGTVISSHELTAEQTTHVEEAQ